MVYNEYNQMNKENQMKDNELLWEVVRIISQPGEEITDGECLDEVWALLKSNGYDANNLRIVEGRA